MSTPQPGKSGIDVRLDEQGRIVVLSPEPAQAFAPSDGNLSWFGGEPMLARGIVEEGSAHAAESAAGPTGFDYRANMTTNGYLLDAEAVRDLAALGVGQYQISLPWVWGWAAGDEDAVHCPYRGMPRRRTPTLLQIGATRPA
jgi:hypothetical protein